MKISSTLVFIIFPLILQMGCKNNTTAIRNDLQIDSFELNRVYLYKENQQVKSRKEDFLLNLAQVMSIPSMHSRGNNYLRIWLWNNPTKYVVDVDIQEYNEQAIVYSFNSKFTDSGEVIIILKKWVINQPKDGWETLSQIIEENKIFFLLGGKTTKELKGKIPTQASWVQFEIFYDQSYRYYDYFEPGFYRKIDSDSKCVYDFLNKLDKSLTINFYNYPATFFYER